jgi:plastocyanin
MRVKRMVGAALAVMALTAGMVGCSSESKSKSVGASADVKAKDDPKPHFDPDVLQAALNSEVAFSLKNDGKVVHNFTLSFLGVDQDVQPGETVQVRFTVKQPPHGEQFFTFYDKNYQGEGMQGRLNVK